MIIVMQRIDGKPCVVDVSEVLPFSDGNFQVVPLVRFAGEVKGRRRWRMVNKSSRLLTAMADLGVEMMSGPTLLPPLEPERVAAQTTEPTSVQVEKP